MERPDIGHVRIRICVSDRLYVTKEQRDKLIQEQIDEARFRMFGKSPKKRK